MPFTFYDYLLTVREDKHSFRLFLKQSHFGLSKFFFIYKWHVIKINVLFLASNVMIQYGYDDYSEALI